MKLNRKIDEWGRVVFSGENAAELLFNDLDIIKLNLEITDEIETYNEVCVEHDKLNYIIKPFDTPSNTPEQELAIQKSTWFMPEKYLSLDVRKELFSRCDNQEELDRINLEMDMYENRDLLPVLRLMFYLVDEFRKKGIVWGVGRGSSVASYCLFLIGIHRINSIEYDLDIHEFLK